MLYNNHIQGPAFFVRPSFFGKALRGFGCVCMAVTIVLLSGCSKDDPEPANEFFVESVSILSRDVDELRVFIGASSSLNFDLNAMEYDVEIFRVKYKTHYKGESIIASTLVILPKTSDPVGMISFQHGTITAQSEAPTNLPLNSTTLILYAGLSSVGFVTVVPDFIGFGESSNVFHPYYVEEATANAVIDAVRAAGEFADDEDVNFNERLFLAGYSQGGYATMAAHKYIETNGLPGYELVASFPAAGGYMVKGMQEYFFSQETYDQPYYLAYVAMSYNTYYDWESGSLAQLFNEPYATRIPTLFNGTNGSGTINGQLTTDISALVQADLLANIDTDPDYGFFVELLNQNSLDHWTPTIPMYMYHGDADVTVPYENSVATYNHFIVEHGASPSVVTLTTLEGGTHATGVLPYIEDFVEKLIALK